MISPLKPKNISSYIFCGDLAKKLEVVGPALVYRPNFAFGYCVISSHVVGNDGKQFYQVSISSAHTPPEEKMVKRILNDFGMVNYFLDNRGIATIADNYWMEIK